MGNKKRIVASIRMSFTIITKKNMPIYGSWEKTSKMAKWSFTFLGWNDYNTILKFFFFEIETSTILKCNILLIHN